MRNFLSGDNAFNRVMTRVFDLCLLNVLTLVFCVPVVTAGASLTAMYAVMMKMAANEEGPIIKSFWKEFRQNLKGSFGGWLALLALMLLLVVDLALWAQNEVEYRSLFYGLTAALLLFLSAVADWYFALRAKFEETSVSGIKNGLKFALVYFPATILMGGYTLGLIVLLYYIPDLMLLLPFAGLAVLAYPKSIYIRKKFDAYIKSRGLEKNEEKQDAEESNEVKEEEREEADIPSSDQDQAIRDRVRADKKRQWQSMTWPEKLDHIWTYYRAWIFSAVFVIAGAVWLVSRYLLDNEECGFSLGLINGYMEKGDVALSAELDEFFGFQEGETYAYFDTAYQFSYTGVENSAGDNSFYEKFFLNIRMGELDAVIMPESFFEYCNDLEPIFCDVRSVLSEEQQGAWEDYYVMGQTEDGAAYACGIDISHLDYINAEGMGFVGENNGEAFILAFPVTGEHRALGGALLRYIEKMD